MSRNRDFNTDPFQTAGVEQGEDNAAYDDMMDAIAPGAPVMPFKGRRVRVPDNALVRQGDGSFRFKDATITQVGLVVDGELSNDDLLELGSLLIHMEGSVGWNIGDWCEYARNQWGKSYEEIADQYGYPVDTLMTYAYICREYHTSIRNRDVSMSHHRIVIKLPNREEWLRKAADNGWTVDELSKAIQPKRRQRTALPASQRAMKTVQSGYKKLETPQEKREYLQALRAWLDAMDRG